MIFRPDKKTPAEQKLRTDLKEIPSNELQILVETQQAGKNTTKAILSFMGTMITTSTKKTKKMMNTVVDTAKNILSQREE